MAKFSSYPFQVEPFTEDYLGRLSWGTLGNLVLRCASLHAGEHGFGYLQMAKISHGWVLSRLVLDVDEMPRSGERFTVETWVDRLYRQFTDRHFSFLRPDGTAYGHGTSVWSLIDMTSRRPADLTSLPDGGFTSTLIPERPAPIAGMGRMRPKELQLAGSHRAAYTDLDTNGHVNSIRYIELLLDTFTPEEIGLHPPRRIETAYCREAVCGDTLYIYKERTDAERSLFEIRLEDGEVLVKAAIICK